MANHDILRARCLPGHFARLTCLDNPRVLDFAAEYAALCEPDAVFVRTDTPADAAAVRARALEAGEESALAVPGHSIHFDGPQDQGRDKGSTKFLLTPEMDLGSEISGTDRAAGLAEMRGLLGGSMRGRTMYVLFLCLGPVDSPFSIYAVQLTDSAYVAHSEDILYRPAYASFRAAGAAREFFRYVHSAGELDGRKASRNPDKRRIYVDLLENIVYSANTQNAGNTVGLKKLSLRLAVRKACAEKWLAEHMFVMRIAGPGGRGSYFLGAFPSMCGKTSTCMVPGERIVGDDIAYLRKRDGAVCAVNVERGIFGIIKDVNAKDDPEIWKVLTGPGEVIFSNVLVRGGAPLWDGDGRPAPESGVNFAGPWTAGARDAAGEAVPFSHPNARYTIRLDALANCDPVLEDPAGVPVEGIIYGGRDSDTWPPVFESFDWQHGVVTVGGSLESETTAATLGKTGERKFNVMANLDFLSVRLGDYLNSHLAFADGLNRKPVIFGVNYFQKDADGGFLTGKQDKRVWLKWMERRAHGDIPAIRTPIGFLPHYEVLRDLFRQVLDREYDRESYIRQFSVRVPENLAKIARIEAVYRRSNGIPPILFDILAAQKERLEQARAAFGDSIHPDRFAA